MSCPFNKESVAQLKTFITLCQTRPELLHIPDLAFFKDFVESLGGTIPNKPDSSTECPTTEPSMADTDDAKAATPEEQSPDIEADPESDLDLDMEGCLEPDTLDDTQKMGDPDKEPTEEETDQADEIKREALSQLGEGNYAKAVELLTDAIEVNPKLAMLFTKRGQVYLKLNKPNACIKDCTHGLELNCDSATGYKFRGRAYRLIGKWEEAAKDLRQACKIDFDEQADDWLKEVQPNAIKIEQHKVRQERKRLDKEEKDKAERVKRAREAHAKAAKEKQHGGEPKEGAAPPGGANMDDFLKFMQDPEIMAAFKDPEVAAAFQDISLNPANIIKYQSNPKVQALLGKLSSKIGGAGGGFPGFPMGGMGGMGGPPGAGTEFPAQDDGLD